MDDLSFPDRSQQAHRTRLQLLGPLRVWLDDTELDVGPRQQGYLLALLLARVGRPTSMSELVDLLWDDDVPRSAINIVQKYVGSIRRLLEPDLATREPGEFVVRGGGGYALSAHQAAVDLVEFRSQVNDARAHLASGRPGEALEAYVEGLRLWHGPAGDGFQHTATATPLFAGINEEFFDACVAAAELARTQGHPDRVVQPLRLASWMAPFHEPVHASLLEALAATGKQAEALSVYESVRSRLLDDLGVEPGDSLRAAHARVLRRTSTMTDALPGDPSMPLVREADRSENSGAAGVHSDRRGGAALVGRSEELDLLNGAFGATAAGGTALVLVEGEPGTGKTSLLEQFVTSAEGEGAIAVWGRCLNHEGTPALWPWTRLVADLLAQQRPGERARIDATEVGRLLDPQPDSVLGGSVLPDSGAQFRMFEQTVELFERAASDQPLILVVDDLQWADVASLHLFRHAAMRQPRRVMLVGLLRDRAPAPGDELRAVLAAVGRLPQHQRILLGPLQPDEVGELVRREIGHEPSAWVARCIQARTEGNPFFVRELARLLADGRGSEADVLDDALVRTGVPSTVRDIVRDRLATLGQDTRKVVEVAALMGREVDLRLLSRSAGLEVSESMTLLEPAVALGLLGPARDSPFSVRFTHDLVRESVDQTTSQLCTGQLHVQIADALQDTYVDDDSITERLARHLWLAGPLADPARTADALVRAGRRAVAQSAFDSAVPHLESAATIARSSGLLELELSAVSQLVAVIGMQSGYMGEAEPTWALLERAENVARQLGREREAIDFLFSRWAAYSQGIQLSSSGELARRLLIESERTSDPVVRAYGRHAWGIHQWDVGNVGEAYRQLSESRSGVANQESRRNDDPLRHDLQLLSPAMLALNTALHGRVDEARALLDVIETEAGDHSYDIAVWSAFAVTTAAFIRDPAWALRAADRGIAADPEHSFAFLGTYQRLGRCWARAMLGQDVDQATVEAETLIASNLTDPPRSGLTTWLAFLSEMYFVSGRYDEAREALRRADASISAHGQLYAAAFVELMRAKLSSVAGEGPAAVREAVEQALATAQRQEALLFVLQADHVQGRCAHEETAWRTGA